MSERPILFSAPMVRAILAGTKTQTRRVVKPQPHPLGDDPVTAKKRCPYGQPGDRLWVRETFAVRGNEDGHPERTDGTLCGEREAPRFYRADCKQTDYGMWQLPDGSLLEGWRSSLHMPRWASRITLEVVSVRVERLQNISEPDAQAEGCLPDKHFLNQLSHLRGSDAVRAVPSKLYTAKERFAQLWDSINAKRAPWASNPWVWAVEFRRCV